MPLFGAVSVTVAVVAPAVPESATSPVTKFATGSLNTTVKLIGEAEVGSAWPDAAQDRSLSAMEPVREGNLAEFSALFEPDATKVAFEKKCDLVDASNPASGRRGWSPQNQPTREDPT